VRHLLEVLKEIVFHKLKGILLEVHEEIIVQNEFVKSSSEVSQKFH
jgi:hypothetical protein